MQVQAVQSRLGKIHFNDFIVVLLKAAGCRAKKTLQLQVDFKARGLLSRRFADPQAELMTYSLHRCLR
jgi:hypothetical protein